MQRFMAVHRISGRQVLRTKENIYTILSKVQETLQKWAWQEYDKEKDWEKSSLGQDTALAIMNLQ